MFPPGAQPHRPDWFGKITFAVEEYISLENIVVTVRPPPPRIRGRILQRDGSPLANAQVGLTVKERERETFFLLFYQ